MQTTLNRDLRPSALQVTSTRLSVLGALAVLAGALTVIGLTVDAVYADDPMPKLGGTAGKPAKADLMTVHGINAQPASFGRKHTPSPLILPDQTIPIRFSHALHVDLVNCTDCHTEVANSIRSKDRNLPLEAVCLDCHDAKAAAEGKPTDPPASCDTCHPGYTPEWLPGADFSKTSEVKIHPPAIVIPDPNLKFNHKAHIQIGVGCDTCHGTMKNIELATRDNSLPLMATCVDCHDGTKHKGKVAQDQCRTCHLTTPDGRIDTDLPGGKLAPEGWYFMDAHDDNWLSNHRAVATLGDDSCNACHTQKECLDCHNGVNKPLKVHPNNWVLSHTVPAKRNDPECASCHRTQTFCVDCHEATKVGVSAGNRPPSTVEFHPEGWLDRDNLGQPAQMIRGPNHHSFQAQRNIRTCASCHTESSCIACHGSDGVDTGSPYRINPHPPGWSQSADCVRMRNKNERSCYKCHAVTAQAIRCGN